MMFRFLLIALLLSARFINAYGGELEPTNSKLVRALAFLQQTKTGSIELAEAKDLLIPIRIGKVSKTEITATRTHDGSGDAFEYRMAVDIAEDKEAVFQALDIAHELIHATHAKNNPFDPKLDAATYVTHGIEGEGGEADAIAEECQVGKELSEGPLSTPLTRESLQLIKTRCQFVWNTSPDLEHWRKSFYFLGPYYADFMKSILNLSTSEVVKKNWAKLAETRNPVFSSAVAHKPYPLALLEEYVAITHKVCDRAKTATPGRVVSSLSSLKGRCAMIGIEIDP